MRLLRACERLERSHMERFTFAEAVEVFNLIKLADNESDRDAFLASLGDAEAQEQALYDIERLADRDRFTD
jgi:hypothetical protein